MSPLSLHLCSLKTNSFCDLVSGPDNCFELLAHADRYAYASLERASARLVVDAAEGNMRSLMGKPGWAMLREEYPDVLGKEGVGRKGWDWGVCKDIHTARVANK